MTYLPSPPGTGSVATTLSGTDIVAFAHSGLPEQTTLAALKAFVLAAAMPAATSASGIVGVPTSGSVGSTISGMTVTLGPAGSTAWAVLSNGKTDIGTRVMFS